MKLALLVASVALAAAPLSADCFGEAERSASISTAGAQSIHVIGRSGTLLVQGKAGLSEARATGKVCASTRQLVDEIRIDVSRKGDVVTVEAIIPEDRGSIWPFGLGGYAQLDLVVELPSNLPVRVTDGSGETWIRDIGAGNVRDGSGALEITNVSGNLVVSDGSGSMVIRKVGGTVEITDGSGSIEVDEVGNNVIVTDGSGSMDISNVRGNVIVENDGSGGITVSNVGGDFTVRNDGSGGVDHTDVRGQVRLPRD